MDKRATIASWLGPASGRGCWLPLIVLASLASADEGWTTLRSEAGAAGDDARSKYVEFELPAKSAVRFTWVVEGVGVPGRKVQVYYRLKLERWVERKRDGVWQNVGPIATVHRSDRGTTTQTLPAGKFRLTIYYRNLKHETTVAQRGT